MKRYDEDSGCFIDMCGKCGEEGPLREGEVESCVSSQGGSFVLHLCRRCRENTTVEQALELLANGPRPRRVSLMEQLTALASRVEALERRRPPSRKS